MNIEIINPADLAVGMDVTAHWGGKHYGSGTGGIIVAINDNDLDPRVTLESGTARIINVIRLAEIDHWTQEVPYDAEECLDYHPDHCDGPVDDWWSGGMNGRTWPRCTFHGERRLERHENSIERYADSDVVPDWFDPSYAGERWSEDD